LHLSLRSRQSTDISQRSMELDHKTQEHKQRISELEALLEQQAHEKQELLTRISSHETKLSARESLRVFPAPTVVSNEATKSGPPTPTTPLSLQADMTSSSNAGALGSGRSGAMVRGLRPVQAQDQAPARRLVSPEKSVFPSEDIASVAASSSASRIGLWAASPREAPLSSSAHTFLGEPWQMVGSRSSSQSPSRLGISPARQVPVRVSVIGTNSPGSLETAKPVLRGNAPSYGARSVPVQPPARLWSVPTKQGQMYR